VTAGADGERESLEQFAASLRQLRLEADSPTLERLHRETGVSRTVLSEAFSGKKLPSARTVDRIAVACGGDARDWVSRRDRLARHHSAPPAPPTARRTMLRRTGVLLAVGAFVLGAGLSAAVASAVTLSDAAAAPTTALSPEAQINVRTGIDPAMTPCVNDAKVATGDMRDDGQIKIEIIWSNKCYAGWARVTRYDGKWENQTITVAIYPETAPMGPDRQSATEPNVQGAYTTLIVRPSPQTRLCAVGSITVNNNNVDLGPPICI
jgi:hypothetical protein